MKKMKLAPGKSGWFFLILLLFIGAGTVQAKEWNVITDFNISPGSTVYLNSDLQTELARTSPGDSILFPCVKDANGVVLWYRFQGTVEITKSLTITGPADLSTRPIIRQTLNSTSMFKVLASGVTFQNVYLRGTGRNVGSGKFYGIDVKGTSSNQLNHIKVLDCTVREWGYGAISYEYVRDTQMADSRIRKNNIRWIGYTGIQLLSSKNVQVDNNIVDTVTCRFDNHGYGIVASSRYPSDLRSENILINWNTVSNVAIWEGIDSHAGIGILIKDNKVSGCPRGIVVTHLDYQLAAKGCHIIRNTVTGNNSNSAYIYGINVSGAKNGDTYIYAEDCSIRYNKVKYFGGGSIDAGNIRAHTTKRLQIFGNEVQDAKPVGMMIGWYNENLQIYQNSIDKLGQTNMEWGIRIRSHQNTGLIERDNIFYGFTSEAWAIRIDISNPGLTIERPLNLQ